MIKSILNLFMLVKAVKEILKNIIKPICSNEVNGERPTRKKSRKK